MKTVRIKIRSAQHVGKVWISREKIFLAPFGVIPGHFLHGPEKKKQHMYKIYIFSLVGQWALFTRFGVMCCCDTMTLDGITNQLGQTYARHQPEGT